MMENEPFVSLVAGRDGGLHHAAGGPILVGGAEAGWWEPFEDPLLDTVVLRLWLDAASLAPTELHKLTDQLTTAVGEAVHSLSSSPRVCTVEANRVFPVRDAKAASVLLRFDSSHPGCGRCTWAETGCDDWFIEQLVESFVTGCRRFGDEVDRQRVYRYVQAEIGPMEDCQWWSFVTPGSGRTGVMISYGHEDVIDGRPYTQCVDVVGPYSTHLSCLCSELTRTFEGELRGEVTVGTYWQRERRVLRRLHGAGWRIRGLTSLLPVATCFARTGSKGGGSHANCCESDAQDQAQEAQD